MYRLAKKLLRMFLLLLHQLHLQMFPPRLLRLSKYDRSRLLPLFKRNLLGYPSAEGIVEHYCLFILGNHKLRQIFDQFIPLTLTVVGTLISNVLIDGIYTYQSGTPNRVLVLLIVAIISYSISQFFIGIYSETIQSLFVIDLVHNNLLTNP